MSEQDKTTPMDDGEQRRLAEAVAGRLDDTLEPDVAARLRAARQEAVYIAERQSRSTRWLRPLLPIGGVAAAGLAIVLLVNEPALQSMPALDDAEMAAAAEMEFLDELEMLAWLDDEALDAG